MIILFFFAMFCWWLTGSAWPMPFVWLAFYMTIRIGVYGEVITDWHQPVTAGAIAFVLLWVPRIVWNLCRKFSGRRALWTPLGVTVRTD